MPRRDVAPAAAGRAVRLRPQGQGRAGQAGRGGAAGERQVQRQVVGVGLLAGGQQLQGLGPVAGRLRQLARQAHGHRVARVRGGQLDGRLAGRRAVAQRGLDLRLHRQQPRHLRRPPARPPPRLVGAARLAQLQLQRGLGERGGGQLGVEPRRLREGGRRQVRRAPHVLPLQPVQQRLQGGDLGRQRGRRRRRRQRAEQRLQQRRRHRHVAVAGADQRLAAPRAAGPERLVAVERRHAVGQRGRVGAEHAVRARHERQALGAARRGHDRQTGRQRLRHLALQSGAVAQRRHGHPATVEQRLEVGHEPEHLDARPRQRPHLVGDVPTGDQQARARQLAGRPGPHLAGQPQRGVHVGRVHEVADEDDVATASPPGRVGGDGVRVGHRQRRRRLGAAGGEAAGRRLGPQAGGDHVAVLVGDGEHGVGQGVGAQLVVAGARHLLQVAQLPFQRGPARLAQVPDVPRVDDDAQVRRRLPQQRHGPGRQVPEAHQGGVEDVAVEDGAQARPAQLPAPRLPGHRARQQLPRLAADLVQGAGVSLAVGPLGELLPGHERHAAAGPPQQAQQLHELVVARALVGPRQEGVQDEDVASHSRPFARAESA